MTLEEPDVIDIMAQQADGRVRLIITDAGVTTDPRERFSAYFLKLSHYFLFAVSPAFTEQFPGKSWRDVTITTLTKNPPTPDMLTIVNLCKESTHPGVLIPVEIRIFDPEDDADPAPTPDPASKPTFTALRTPMSAPNRIISCTPRDYDLLMAVIAQRPDEVRSALADGANTMARVEGSPSPLTAACHIGDAETLKLLIAHTPRLTSDDAGTLWRIGKVYSHPAICQVVTEWGFRPTLRDHFQCIIARLKLIGAKDPIKSGEESM